LKVFITLALWSFHEMRKKGQAQVLMPGMHPTNDKRELAPTDVQPPIKARISAGCILWVAHRSQQQPQCLSSSS